MDFAPPWSRSGWTVADHVVGGLHCAEVSELAAAFVLGALEPAEAAAVRAHLAACPEPHGEFAQLGGVVPALLEAVELVAPPANLGARIRAAAEAEQAATAAGQRAAPAHDVAPTPAPQPIRKPLLVDAPRSGGGPAGLFRRPVWAAVSLAAALAVVALGVWNVQLQSQVADLSTYRTGVAAVLDEAARPGAQLAVLAAPTGGTGPSGLAAVGADGTVALVMHELVPTAGAQVYEAWLIGSAGTPVPIGGFTVNAGGSAWFSATHASLGSGVTVALTLEPGPGATAPTLPIVVVGTTAARSG